MQLVNKNILGPHPQAAASHFFLSGISVREEMDTAPLKKMKILLFLALLKKNFISASSNEMEEAEGTVKGVFLKKKVQ